MSDKQRVKRVFKEAFCVKMNTKIEANQYIVWPGPIGARGFERPAIGIGKTAREAWASVKFTH